MKFGYASAVALFAAVTVSAAEVPSLTPDNYDELTDGKTVFIKFFAPWCGHCKKMAPDWERLSDEWSESNESLVAEVDCTAKGKPLCNSYDIKGFPSIKYGSPTSLEDYQGGRTYGDLAEFARENLKPMCSPSKLDLCNNEKRAEIEKLMDMPEVDLASAISDEEKNIKEAEDIFNTEVQKLQDAYKRLQEKKEAAEKSVAEAGLGLMKAVMAIKTKAAKDEL